MTINDLFRYDEWIDPFGAGRVRGVFKAGQMTLKEEHMRNAAILARHIDDQPLLPRMTVWRGVNGKHLKEANIGDIVTDKAFMSTTTNRSIANDFATTKAPNYVQPTAPRHLKPTVMKIQVENGRGMQQLRSRGEDEILLQHHTRMQITGIKETDYRVTFEMKVIP